MKTEAEMRLESAILSTSQVEQQKILLPRLRRVLAESEAARGALNDALAELAKLKSPSNAK